MTSNILPFILPVLRWKRCEMWRWQADAIDLRPGSELFAFYSVVLTEGAFYGVVNGPNLYAEQAFSTPEEAMRACEQHWLASLALPPEDEAA